MGKIKYVKKLALFARLPLRLIHRILPSLFLCSPPLLWQAPLASLSTASTDEDKGIEDNRTFLIYMMMLTLFPLSNLNMVNPELLSNQFTRNYLVKQSTKAYQALMIYPCPSLKMK